MTLYAKNRTERASIALASSSAAEAAQLAVSSTMDESPDRVGLPDSDIGTALRSTAKRQRGRKPDPAAATPLRGRLQLCTNLKQATLTLPWALGHARRVVKDSDDNDDDIHDNDEKESVPKRGKEVSAGSGYGSADKRSCSQGGAKYDVGGDPRARPKARSPSTGQGWQAW